MIYTNYFLPVWFTPSSEKGSLKPAAFLLKPLPYKFLNYLPYFSQLPSSLSTSSPSFNISSDDMALKLSIIDTENIDVDLPVQLWGDILPKDVYMELLNTVKTHFFLLEQDRKDIEYIAAFLLNDKFQDESWSCQVCQKRGLDKQRNCPLFSKEKQKEYFNPSFRLPFNGENITVCPVGKIDMVKASIVSEASAMYQKGILPETGGMGDQTMFFGYASQLMHNKIELKKQKMLAEQQASIKNN